MFRLFQFFIFAAALSLGLGVASADHPQTIWLERTLINPYLLIRNADALALDQTQRQAIEDELQNSREKFAVLQNTLQQEVQALGEVLKQNNVDQEKALSQLDKVLEAERQIKRTHMTLVLSVRGKLTVEQQARARELQEKFFSQERTASATPTPIKDKLQRLSERLARAHREGRDISAVQPIMQEVQSLTHGGKYREAEPLVDRAMKLLDEGEKK